MSTSTYTVSGMTCAHCAASVREEIEEVPGVTGVEVDVASGRVDVSTDGAEADPAAVRAAVAEAGYEVV